MSDLIRKVVSVVMAILMFPTIGNPSTAKRFDVTLDEGIQQICDDIKNNSEVDIEGIVKNFPDLCDKQLYINETFGIDGTAFREKMFELRDEARANGDAAKGVIYHFVGAYISGFKSAKFVFEPYQESKYEIMLILEYGDGVTDRLHSDIIYDPDTGEIYAKNGKGMLGIGFNFNVDEMVLYAVVNCWMREHGFCFAYDLFCYLTPFFFYHTRRFKFDYAGKEWMVQIWKGLYAVSPGGEVGLYNREKGSFGTYYDCASDDEMINMTLEIYHDDELVLKRDEQPHWWINGFKLTKSLYTADELTLKSTLEMKDEEMLKAFCDAIDNELHRDVTYTVDGLRVSIVW